MGKQQTTDLSLFPSMKPPMGNDGITGTEITKSNATKLGRGIKRNTTWDEKMEYTGVWGKREGVWTCHSIKRREP